MKKTLKTILLYSIPFIYNPLSANQLSDVPPKSVSDSTRSTLQTANFSGNPFLPGDFADPAIIYDKGIYYIYATTGGDATVWYSDNFVDWKLRQLNWPTSLKLPNMWAPAVAKGTDGKFYLYYSINSQIYAGVADDPKGPFRNLIPDEAPFIKDKQYFPPKIHSIDADCFIDDDGQAYLYWGSGWDFKDGVCAVGKLGKDMASFRELPVEITPGGYFEGPHVFKRAGKYYLMYSDGIYSDDTYKVRYAISDSPMGPFVEGKNSPILTSDATKGVHGPGHNFTLKLGDDIYIVYHQHELPYYHGNRQICIDKMTFDEAGNINTIVPTKTGLPLRLVGKSSDRQFLRPQKVYATTAAGVDYRAEYAVDDSYRTLWAAPANTQQATIIVDLGSIQTIGGCEPIFAAVRQNCDYKIEYAVSDNTSLLQDTKNSSNNWKPYASGNNAAAKEWPITIEKKIKARFLRLTINQPSDGRLGLWEWRIWQ